MGGIMAWSLGSFCFCVFLVCNLFVNFHWTHAANVQGMSKPLVVTAKNRISDVCNQIKLRDAVSALQSNVNRRLEFGKRMHLGEASFGCLLRQFDVSTAPLTEKEAKQMLTRDALKELIDNNFNFSEVSLDASFEVSPEMIMGGSCTLNVPKTVNVLLRGLWSFIAPSVGNDGRPFSFKADTRELLKRIHFLMQYRNAMLQLSYDNKDEFLTIDAMRQMEDLFLVNEQYVQITPKFQVVFNHEKAHSKFSLAIQRGNSTLTPIFYPSEGYVDAAVEIERRKMEMLFQGKITNEIKIGLFYSKDKKLMINISYNGDWGNYIWQSMAFRFVLPSLRESCIHLTNQIHV
ncbi:hypothetical protein BdWA1_000353 [Babesia duncani]|uniref:Uncharacterized protein n=1 Tax=Babesia duncani TaxID=323732 RepID=A0AAD9PM19_9APIC|nr:hypothetical protein BdWA1_000353 [Babesia duncani]